VKEAVREIKRLKGEVFMPLEHWPGEAQMNFGYALAKVSGVLKKVGFFVMALPYSDTFFVMVFERECKESYWEGHVRAFEFFGGVPNRISYDNTKVLVSKIVGPHEQKLTDGFLKLLSGSGRQGRNPAGESPVMSIPRFGHVAIPRFVLGNRMFIAWCKRPGCPEDVEPQRWVQPGGLASVGA
jgi:hypothetical protein